jgi:hypothetical protein
VNEKTCNVSFIHTILHIHTQNTPHLLLSDLFTRKHYRTPHIPRTTYTQTTLHTTLHHFLPHYSLHHTHTSYGPYGRCPFILYTTQLHFLLLNTTPHTHHITWDMPIGAPRCPMLALLHYTTLYTTSYIPHHMGHGRHAHRRPWMSAVCLLYHLGADHADGVGALGVLLVVTHGMLLVQGTDQELTIRGSRSDTPTIPRERDSKLFLEGSARVFHGPNIPP